MGKTTTLTIPRDLHEKIIAELKEMNIPGFIRVNLAAVVLFWSKMWDEQKKTLTPEEIRKKRQEVLKLEAV